MANFPSGIQGYVNFSSEIISREQSVVVIRINSSVNITSWNGFTSQTYYYLSCNPPSSSSRTLSRVDANGRMVYNSTDFTINSASSSSFTASVSLSPTGQSADVTSTTITVPAYSAPAITFNEPTWNEFTIDSVNGISSSMTIGWAKDDLNEGKFRIMVALNYALAYPQTTKPNATIRYTFACEGKDPVTFESSNYGYSTENVSIRNFDAISAKTITVTNYLEYQKASNTSDKNTETSSFNYNLTSVPVPTAPNLNDATKFFYLGGFLTLPYPANALSCQYTLSAVGKDPVSAAFDIGPFKRERGVLDYTVEDGSTMGTSLNVNCSYDIYIKQIVYQYYYLGEVTSATITNDATTKTIVTWPKTSISTPVLEAAINFTSQISEDKSSYTFNCSLDSGIYPYFNTGDRLSYYISRNSDGVISSGTNIPVSSNRTFNASYVESVGNMQQGDNVYTLLIEYEQKTGTTTYVTTSASSTFTINRGFAAVPPSVLTKSMYNTNGKWYFQISNDSLDARYTKCTISVKFIKYVTYVPKTNGAGQTIYCEQKITNFDDNLAQFGSVPYGSKDYIIDLIKPQTTNEQLFPAATSVVYYRLFYWNGSTNLGSSSETPIYVTPYMQSAFQSSTINVNSLKAIISNANVYETERTLDVVYAGNAYSFRATGQVTLVLPMVFDSTLDTARIKNSISNNLILWLRQSGTGAKANMHVLFSFNNENALGIPLKLNNFVGSKYANGFYIEEMLYDEVNSRIALKGTFNQTYDGLIARYNTSDFTSQAFYYPICENQTEKTFIEMTRPKLEPNISLSKPWKRLSGNAVANYNQDSPALHISWANPLYPNDSEDAQYGYVKETAIKIKREHKVGSDWVIDTLFGDSKNSEWKTVTTGTTSYDDYLYGEESLTSSNKNDEAYNKEIATLYRTYRYTICGYNDIASGGGDNRYSLPFVTAEITPSTKVVATSIFSVDAEVNEVNEIIKVSWVTNAVNWANGQYPVSYYKVYTKSYESDTTWTLLADDIRNNYFIHIARTGLPYFYRVVPYSLYPGASKDTTYSVTIPVRNTDKSIRLPFEFSQNANTSIIKVANRTFYLSDMDRAIVAYNNKVYKAGIKRPKFVITVTASRDVSDASVGVKTLQAGSYEAYVVLVRKDTGTRSNPSDAVKFTIGNNQNKIVFTAPLDDFDRVPLRDKAYTSYGKEILSADYWEVYIKCLDNDSFGEPVCVGSANTITNIITVMNVSDDDILAVTNRRLPITLPYSIAPCCSVGEFYNNRLYLTGEATYFTCGHFAVTNGNHYATVGEIVPEGVVGKQIYVDGSQTGWTVTDIEYGDNITTLDIEHFDITTNAGGWDLETIDSSSSHKITFQTTSSRVYYSAYFFGEPDGVTYTFSPETFPPFNVLESELSSNDFSSPIALVKSRDSLFVGKKDKMISVTGGNTDDNTYIANTTISILSNTLGVLGRRTIARDDQDNVYCLSDHGLVIITTSGVNLVNYIGNTRSSFRLLFDLSDIKNACAVWSPRDQYYVVFGLRFKGESSYTAGLIYDNYVQQVRPFSLPVEVTAAMVCPAENGEYQIVIADSDGCIGTFLDRRLAHDLVFDWSDSTYKMRAIKGNITTGVYKPTYGLTLGPNLLPGFRPALPEIDGANSSALIKPQNVTVGFDLLGRTNYFNQFNPEVDASVNFTIPMKNNIRRIAIPQKTGQALSVRVDFEVMENHIEFGSAMVEVNEETY